MQRHYFAGLVLVIAFGTLFVTITTLQSSSAAGRIVFIVPASTGLSGVTSDKIIVTGSTGPTPTFIDARNCAPNGELRPVQNAVVVNPGSQLHTRTTIVTISQDGVPQTEPLRPGTQLDVELLVTSCTASGVPHYKYEGFVSENP